MTPKILYLWLGFLAWALLVVIFMATSACEKDPPKRVDVMDCPTRGLVTWKAAHGTQLIVSVNCRGKSFTTAIWNAEAHQRCALKDDYPACKRSR